MRRGRPPALVKRRRSTLIILYHLVYLFGSNFTNDVITYKVRHEYGGAVVDYRGFYLGNN